MDKILESWHPSSSPRRPCTPNCCSWSTSSLPSVPLISTCSWAWRWCSWHGANGCPTTGGCYTPPSNRCLAFRSSHILFIRSILGRRAKGLDRRVDLSEAAVGDLDLAHLVLLPVLVGLRLVLGVRQKFQYFHIF